MTKCVFCNKEFEARNNREKCCRTCFLARKDDLIEIIHQGDKIQANIFKEDGDEAAVAFLGKLEAPTCVADLHNVLDTTNPKENFGPGIVCCSFVGKLSEMRTLARKEIVARIKAGQISWGCLVFKRGPRENREIANAFNELGSKAWVCSVLKPKLFVDDAWDHINSVKSVGIRAVKFRPSDDLAQLLKLKNQN